MGKPLCIYHGNCADGFTAAWAINKYFDGQVDFHAGVHQQPPPDVKKRHVIIVDFSYKKPVLEEMAKEAFTILVLDHHKSAAADLKDFPKPIFKAGWAAHLADANGSVASDVGPGIPRVQFDMERSGARMAWDFFFHDKPVPEIVKIVEDRDLWRFNLPYTRSVMTCIFSHEYTFENWNLLHNRCEDHMALQEMAIEGEAIDRKHFKDIREFIATAGYRMDIAGHNVPVLNAPYFYSSDAGHIMAENEPFAACYWDTPDGRVFSLRSQDDGIDVSEIAVQFGGGGHKRAAGYKVPI